MLHLANDDVELVLAPETGGSIAALRWRGHDLLRGGDPAAGPLAMASFPLIPFSNRIAGGRFSADGCDVVLPANIMANGRGQTIHGFGWQAVWEVADHGPAHVRLVWHHPAGDWPWPFTAQQHFALTPNGLTLTLSLTNEGTTPMPAGLGIHPYFPREGARLDLAVDGRWDVDEARLPTGWTALTAQPDWFGGDVIDHGFTGRSGPIRIDLPTHRLEISPDAALAHTIVYVPPGADYFCVEPVTHMTNAVNRAEPPAITGLCWLEPGATRSCAIQFAAAEN